MYSVNYKVSHDDASQKKIFFFMEIYFGTQFIRATKGHTVCIIIIKWTVRMNFMDKGQGCHGQGKPEKNKDFSRSREKSGNIRENLRCLLKSVKSRAIRFSFRKALILFVACL